MQDLCYDWLKHAVRFVRSTQKTANLTREESERGGLTPRVTGEVKQFTDKALAAYLKTQVNLLLTTKESLKDNNNNKVYLNCNRTFSLVHFVFPIQIM